MPIEILGSAKDHRTDTRVIYAKIPIADYLDLVGKDFDQFEIQRSRQKHKAYKRLREDAKKGALLPSITLAVKPDHVGEILELVEPQIQGKRLREALAVPGRVQILDGLQRTYILDELRQEGHSFVTGQTLLVEFWLESSMSNLIYRIIVLNAGQKPMSLRHQVELLFMTMRERLEKEIAGLEIITERDAGRRGRARRYALDRVVTAYQSFSTGSPEVQRENIVADKIVEGSMLDSDEDELVSDFERFKAYLARYADLDEQVCRVYSGGENGLAWWGSENVMNAVFAAVSAFGATDDRKERVDRALERLMASLRKSVPGDDPLGLATYNRVIQGFNTRKVNVGSATRRLLTAVFKEYFRDEGATQLERLWATEAE